MWLAGVVQHGRSSAFVGVGLHRRLAGALVGLFTSDPAIVPSASACLRIVALRAFCSTRGAWSSTQAFNGAGDTRTPTVINLCVFWLWEIPLAYVSRDARRARAARRLRRDHARVLDARGRRRNPVPARKVEGEEGLNSAPMHPGHRAAFNAAFAPALAARYAEPTSCAAPARMPGFRLAETPVFLTPELDAALAKAAREIVDALSAPGLLARMKQAIPPRWDAPGMDPIPSLAQVDFAVVREGGRPRSEAHRAAGLPVALRVRGAPGRRVERGSRGRRGPPAGRVEPVLLRARPERVRRPVPADRRGVGGSRRGRPAGPRARPAEDRDRLLGDPRAARGRERRPARPREGGAASFPRRLGPARPREAHLQPHRVRRAHPDGRAPSVRLPRGPRRRGGCRTRTGTGRGRRRRCRF